MIEEKREELAAWIAAQAGVPQVGITGLSKLSGGAIQENWAVDAAFPDGAQRFVLRTDSPSGVAVSHGRAQEYALFRAQFGGAIPGFDLPMWLARARRVVHRLQQRAWVLA